MTSTFGTTPWRIFRVFQNFSNTAAGNFRVNLITALPQTHCPLRDLYKSYQILPKVIKTDGGNSSIFRKVGRDTIFYVAYSRQINKYPPSMLFL
jgi:hypothetical protein